MPNNVREGLVEGLAVVVGPAHSGLHSVCLVPGLRRESCSSAADSALIQVRSKYPRKESRSRVRGMESAMLEKASGTSETYELA